jgi:uncharacterized membrane protein
MKERLFRSLLAVFIAAYTIVFFMVAYEKYQSFRFYDLDLAVINQAFWNAAHGAITYKSPGACTVFSGGHVELIILLLTPIYAIFPSPLTLLFLQSLALALGGWAIYLIGKILVRPSVGFLLAVCYLIYPALNWVNLFEFHTVAFATPLILWMFYFYASRRWRLFCLFVFLSLSCREDVAIPVFAVGVFALIKAVGEYRRQKGMDLKWGLLPLVSSFVWIMLCIKFIQPYFLPDALRTTVVSKGGLGFYAWLGDSLSEIVKTVVFHPGVVCKGIATLPKLTYLLHLFTPLAFLPIFSPSALLMAAISLVEGMLSGWLAHCSIRFQYSSIVTPLVFIASIYGIKNILRVKALAGREGGIYAVVLAFALSSAWLFGPLPNLPGEMKYLKVTEEDLVRQKMVEAIPEDAAVCTTFRFTPKLSMRPQLFYFYHIYIAAQRAECRVEAAAAQRFSQYLLVDFNDLRTFHDFYTPGGDAVIRRFLLDGNWELVETVNSLALFKRGPVPSLGLVRVGDCREAGHILDLTPAPGIQLCGYTLEKGMAMGERVIILDVYCQRLKASSANYFIAARFTSRRDPGYFFEMVLFAPFRIYSPSHWRDGEVVIQRCNILIPRQSPPGEYDMRLALCSEGDFIRSALIEKKNLGRGWIAYEGTRDIVLP